VRRRRQHLHGRRRKASVPLVALVGYTNAGKTTLFNLLTRESAEASDALFVTLDPLVRQIRLSDKRRMLVSDTVGFIDRLPHTLVAAFRATLEQVAEADLVLHVIDAATPDRDSHIEAVHRVLAEVGASGIEQMEVFNKCDLIEAGEADRLIRLHPGSFCISALSGKGRDEIVDAIAERLELDTHRVTLEFDSDSAEDRERIARVYRQARVVSHVTSDGRVAIEADVPRRVLERMRTADHR
jgi:GTP-binding protein HflX